MNLCCQQDERRNAVRRMQGWNGLDYVEVDNDQLTLRVYFLGKLPPELRKNMPGIERYLRLEGGQRVTAIRIADVDPVIDPDPEKDDYLVVQLDRYGDFSTYTLRLVDVANIDARYDHVDFSFKVDCPSDLDCAPACACEPPLPAEPEISYLAKDYASFRQLMLDRLALLMPAWAERHVPDLGIALVEVLAYTGDHLSYYQDAVATEAYLDTARQRISVRRHVRLVDYLLHEGCNARAWVCLEVSVNLALDAAKIAFITGLNDALTARQSLLTWEALRDVAPVSYEVFEPLMADRSVPIQLYRAHNEIHLYTWGLTQCCLERGITSAVLLDAWVAGEAPHAGTNAQTQKATTTACEPPGDGPRALQLKPGDVLIFEEILGPVTGLPADADPARRHAVRLTRVTPGKDPVRKTSTGQPIPYLEIEWAVEDALPFTLCISAIGAAPDCRYLEKISVARGNVLLVDHGKTLDSIELGTVPTLRTESTCICPEHPGDIQHIAGRFRPSLAKTPLTYSTSVPADDPVKPRWVPAAALLTQDVRAALPQVSLASTPAEAWEPRYDLLDSRPDDRYFVVEIDNDGIPHLRFGDGELGYAPAAGMKFNTAYRIGNGTQGNVGAESISRLVLKNTTLSGVSVAVRNPLPARGGVDAEPTAEARVYAPRAFRKRIERAITAGDYQEIAERNPKVQRASAALVWTGSWYEADVAIDPLDNASADPALLQEIAGGLYRYRRMGHDLHVTPALYVPLELTLDVCAQPHSQRAQVKAALLDVFSNRILPGGQRGFFHVDKLTFGEGLYLSRIIALAHTVAGVASVQVTRFRRRFESANHELEDGVLRLRRDEIAQLDNNPNYPEYGKLDIVVRGGR